MRTLITAVIITVVTNFSFAKEYTIRIFSDYLEEYVENVRIYNEFGAMLGETDKFGEYILQNNFEKNAKFTLKHPNYKDTTIVFGKENHYIHMKMTEEFENQIRLEDAQSTMFSDTTNIINELDKSAEFKGGYNELIKFLANNIIYPQAALEDEISGKVYLKFIIEIDGSVNEVVILKGVSRSIDRESIRVVKLSSKKWNPGMVNDQPVRSMYTIPINFNLQ
jgi:TonB family protein